MNSFPRVDVNPVNGQVYIVYPSNPNGSDGSDIFFVRSTNGGGSWSAPLRVNDDHTTSDQFFPDLAVNSDGKIEVIWYDRRRDPLNFRINVFKAISRDGGLSFGANSQVTLGSGQIPAVGYDYSTDSTYMGDYIDIKPSVGPNGLGERFLLAWGDFRRLVETGGGVRPDQDVFFAPD